MHRPSGRPIEPLSPEEFSRSVRDLDALRRKLRHLPRHVVLTGSIGQQPVSLRSESCLDEAREIYGLRRAMGQSVSMALWLSRGRPAWHHVPEPFR